MKNKDVKVGMKVVPFRKTKTVWGEGSLKKSAEWQEAKSAGFMYVVEWDKDEGAWVLSARNRKNNPHKAGDFFKARDFKPYEPSV